MKKWLGLIALCLAPSLGHGEINITEGSGKTVHTDTVNGLEYQAIKIIDGTTGGTSSATVTANGALSVAIDTSSNTVKISTGGVTASQGSAGTRDWPVRLTSTTILGTVTVDGSGVTQPVSGSVTAIQGAAGTADWRVTMSTNAVTGTVTSNQGTAGTADWPVRVSTVVVNQGTPGVTDWRVTMATNAVTGTVTSNQGTAGTTDWPVRVSTVVVNQGTPGVTDWRVTMATNTVTQGGTWTVQPGNTPNTTDWRVTMATATVTQGGTWTVQPGNTPNTTDWRVTMATNTVAQGTANTIEWPVRVSTVALQTGTNNIGTVTGSTVTIYPSANGNLNVNVAAGSVSATLVASTTGTWNQVFPGVGAAIAFTGPTGLTQSGRVDASSNVLVSVSTNVTLAVHGPAATGAAVVGNPLYTGGYASSTTLPTQQTDGDVMPFLVDDLGRMIVKGGVPEAMVSYATATLTTTATTVLISSSTSGNSARNYLCGITINNTSATATYVTVFPAGNPTAASTALPIYVPAGMITGYRKDCDNVVTKSNFASAISVQPAASVSSLLISASYYLGP